MPSRQERLPYFNAMSGIVDEAYVRELVDTALDQLSTTPPDKLVIPAIELSGRVMIHGLFEEPPSMRRNKAKPDYFQQDLPIPVTGAQFVVAQILKAKRETFGLQSFRRGHYISNRRTLDITSEFKQEDATRVRSEFAAIGELQLSPDDVGQRVEDYALEERYTNLFLEIEQNKFRLLSMAIRSTL